MNSIIKSLAIAACTLATLTCSVHGQNQIYCNPMDLDYGYCPIPDFVLQGKHRTTADPVIVSFRGDYYLFSTNQWGYWWSENLVDWNFVPRKFLKPHHKVYDELCAPAAWVMNDTLYVLGSTYTTDFPIWKSTNPRIDDWTEAISEFPVGAWDPAFFHDDDGKLYLYHGSSNTFPLYCQEIDASTLLPNTRFRELFTLQDYRHGWERFGEAHDNTFLKPFLEGAWMTKNSGKYYLQYSAPGTEFSGYADGVYVSNSPTGPFEYQQHNPFSLKQGGFSNGAGHGSTFQDSSMNWWHVATSTICVKNNFERRLSLFPTYFDSDGTMYSDTAYGDYPTKLTGGDSLLPNTRHTGWMLLNYAKPVKASSTYGAFQANFAVDEDIKTYWSAESDATDEWLESDLGELSNVYAVQVNYADQDADIMGKQPGLYHAFRLMSSIDGHTWTVLSDQSTRRKDTPHALIVLEAPVQTRFVRLVNEHVPTGKFAISGLRIFGLADKPKPKQVERFVVLRGDSEKRNAWLKWSVDPNATGYTVRWGVLPDKLYSSQMISGASETYIRTLDRDETYYFQIEAFNEAGIGPLLDKPIESR